MKYIKGFLISVFEYCDFVKFNSILLYFILLVTSQSSLATRNREQIYEKSKQERFIVTLLKSSLCPFPRC